MRLHARHLFTSKWTEQAAVERISEKSHTLSAPHRSNREPIGKKQCIRHALQPGGVALRRPKTQWTIDDRARWLTELARAIDEAQQLVWRLALLRGDNIGSSEIYGRLEAARDEVQRLQRSDRRRTNHDLDRDWSELLASAATCAEVME